MKYMFMVDFLVEKLQWIDYLQLVVLNFLKEKICIKGIGYIDIVISCQSKFLVLRLKIYQE